MRRRPEYSSIKIGGNGNIEVKIGTQSNGQGHATSYAQIVSEVLQIDINEISLIQGNSLEIENDQVLVDQDLCL